MRPLRLCTARAHWREFFQIRRPYFHVKPLEKGQLNNWRDYLDWEMENGSHERGVVLFERAMIACALYEEFWLKVGAERSCLLVLVYTYSNLLTV